MSRYSPRCSASVLFLVSGGWIWGCDPMPKSKSPALDTSKMALGNTPLYERLGGEPAITLVVDDFVARGAANPSVNFTRKGTSHEWQATPENLDHLKKMLVQFICHHAGGPHRYEGRDMKAVHQGMRITDAEFDALAIDLKASLAKLRAPTGAQAELMAIVESTRKDIVE